MKLCYLADANSIHTKKMCNYFVKKGYDLTVISLNEGHIENVKVYSMNMLTTGGDGSLSKLKYLKCIQEIKKIISDIKPDIVHAHYVSSYGLLASLIGFRPTILSVWGSDVYDFPKKSIIHKNIIKYNLKNADYILSTSYVMKKETEKYTNKDITVTPFGVDINKFKPLEEEIMRNEVVIGTIKSLEKKYGIEYLIRAFKKVKDENNNVNLKLVIGGKGSEEENLKNLCKELGIERETNFIGFIEQSSVVSYLQSFDIAVFSSILDSESFGVAAVEAQACGVPVIVTDVDGLMESTVPNVTSLVVKRESVDDLADKINRLVNDENLRNEMGLKGRQNVEEKYNILDNFSIIDNIYKSAIK